MCPDNALISVFPNMKVCGQILKFLIISLFFYSVDISDDKTEIDQMGGKLSFLNIGTNLSVRICVGQIWFTCVSVSCIYSVEHWFNFDDFLQRKFDLYGGWT